MTKQSYFEMCEAMNSQPAEEEIPLELADFPLEVEQAYNIYRSLQDKVDSFNGIYYGKALEYAPNLLEFFEIEDRQEIFKILLIIDSLEAEQINKKRSKGPSK